MMATRAVHCNLCPRTWPGDPVLEVICPTCAAAIGQPCRRPSGHSVPFGGFHAARDLLAAAEGKYGLCPFDCCRNHPAWDGSLPAALPLQLSLFG